MRDVQLSSVEPFTEADFHKVEKQVTSDVYLSIAWSDWLDSLGHEM